MKIVPALLAFILVFALSCKSDPQTSTSSHEQTSFLDSFPIKYPVAIPPAVSNLIFQTEEAKGTVQYYKSKGWDLEKLLEASEIHLGPADEIHLFVRGMGGADSDWAWIIRHPYKNPEILFFASGTVFEFLTTKSHGYRDFSETLTIPSGEWRNDVYRFNGSTYVRWKHRTGYLTDGRVH